MTPAWPHMRAPLVLILAGLLFGLDAEARTSGTVSYSTADVWPSALRFLRIDRNCVIREKDEAAGYILFDYPDGRKLYKGSLELVRTSDSESRDITRVVISLPDLPRHFEQLLIDKLSAKLREDLGSPVLPPPRKPEPDGGSAR